MEIIFNCIEDCTYPEGVSVEQIKALYVETLIGWIAVTDFTNTRNGIKYKVII